MSSRGRARDFRALCKLKGGRLDPPSFQYSETDQQMSPGRKEPVGKDPTQPFYSVVHILFQRRTFASTTHRPVYWRAPAVLSIFRYF